MILNHVWGIYAHPKEEWHTIDRRHESLAYSLSHILLIALIPVCCSYYGSVYVGWTIGTTDPIMLTQSSALMISIAMYCALITGVLAFAYIAKILANAFETELTYTQTLELAAYTSTPLFMIGFAALYPNLLFITMVGLAGLAYSVYLLYSGVPILMHVPEEKGFIYASSVVTVGLVLLVIMMTSTAIIWSSGIVTPMFTQ